MQQTIAVVASLGLIIFTLFFVIPSIREARRGNAELEKARKIHIPYNFIIPKYNAHIDYDLSAEYPHGTLIVDDPIKFTGVAYTSNFPQNVRSLVVWFQNAQTYPVIQDSRGITEPAQIIFHKTQENV